MDRPVTQYKITRWQRRIRTALDSIKRRDVTQRHLWPHVTINKGWCVEIVGPDVDGRNTLDARVTFFEITQIWPVAGGKAFSSHDVYMYEKESLRIVDTPPEFKRLL